MSEYEVRYIPLCVLYLPRHIDFCRRLWNYIRNRHRALLNAIRRWCFVCTTPEELQKYFPEIYLQAYELDFDFENWDILIRHDRPFIWLKHFGLEPIIALRDEEFSLLCESLLYKIYLNAQREGLHR